MEFCKSGKVRTWVLQGSHSTWKTWKYHGILKKLINIMENDMTPGKTW